METDRFKRLVLSGGTTFKRSATATDVLQWLTKTSIQIGSYTLKINCTLVSITGCPALQQSAHIFSAKPAYIKRPKAGFLNLGC